MFILEKHSNANTPGQAEFTRDSICLRFDLDQQSDRSPRIPFVGLSLPMLHADYQSLDSSLDSHEIQGQTKCHSHITHILSTLKYKHFGNFSNKVYPYLSGFSFNLIFHKLYLLFSTSGFSLLFFMRIFLLRSLGEGKALPGSSCKIIQRKGLMTAL